ncbi:hypothetical protein, partial [uncultured Bifidobacterium sp.]|uniref:hypothetical protein n=1 Tax=uncultured Bifidobacterium sp. TaxID=165187 RepID=UPI00262B6726
MGLMDALRGTTMDAPVVYMDGDESNRRLHALEDRLDTGAAGTDRDALVDRIERLKAGIAGEKRIMFELMNSRMPLFVLHDLNLAHDGL